MRTGSPRILRSGRVLLAVVCAALLASGVRAEDPDPADFPEAKAARSVLRHFAAKDDKALALLAAKDDPDPWMVADWLLAAGEREAAVAFAAAGQRPLTQRLPAYVAAWDASLEEKGARAALQRAGVLFLSGRLRDVLTPLASVAADETDLLSAHIRFSRGMAAYSLRRLEDATEDLEAGLDLARRIGWRALEGQCLRTLVYVLNARGRSADALKHARARVALEKELARSDKLASAYYDLGITALQLEDPDGAAEALAAALPLQRAGGDTRGLARTLIKLAASYAERRDFEAALAHAREAVDLFDAVDDAAGMVDALIAVGSYYESVADYPRSKAFLVRAVQVAEKKQLAFLRARALAHAGVAYSQMGDYPAALRAYDQALEFDRARNDTPRIAMTLNNKAVLYQAIGDLDRARRLLRETITLFEGSGRSEGVATASVNLGMVATFAGDLEQAAAHIDRGLRLHRKAGDASGIALALAARSAVAIERARFAQAVKHLRDAVAILRRSGDRALLASMLGNLGRAQHRAGQSAAALRTLAEAETETRALHAPARLLAILEIIAVVHVDSGDPASAVRVAESALLEIAHLLGGLGEEEGATARAAYIGVFEAGALGALRIEAPEKVLHFLEAGRAGSQLESLGGRDALRWIELPEGLQQAESDARIAQARAATASRRAYASGDLREAAEARKALLAATDRRREAVARIQREAKAQAGLVYPKPASASEIRRHLEPGQALVVYGFCGDLVLAAIVTRDALGVVPVAPAADVRAACEAFLGPTADMDAATAIATLRKLVVDPLKLPASVKQVIVSPARSLCYAPFAALFDVPVAMTPSGTTHALLRSDRQRAGEGVLALGDPAYPGGMSQAGQVYARGGALTRLPHTRAEAKRVGSVVLLGEDANEAALRDALAKQRRWHAVHLACHGRVDRERPTLCALALTPGEEYDGFLTALEVLGLKVPADLVVMSACDTGGGQVVSGEGIVGLTRSFMYAGASRVIASLWKVDDEATAALMTKFYELWKTQGAAEALRAAQAYVRAQDKWSHPYYWAAWVLWGLPD